MATVRKLTEKDIPAAVSIWNKVVEEGKAFPQTEYLDEKSGAEFFAQQTYTAVAELDGEVVGMYILHPNNIGRCGHICNASYAVKYGMRGKHIGEALVTDCLEQAKAHGFGILQFNALDWMHFIISNPSITGMIRSTTIRSTCPGCCSR